MLSAGSAARGVRSPRRRASAKALEANRGAVGALVDQLLATGSPGKCIASSAVIPAGCARAVGWSAGWFPRRCRDGCRWSGDRRRSSPRAASPVRCRRCRRRSRPRPWRSEAARSGEQDVLWSKVSEQAVEKGCDRRSSSSMPLSSIASGRSCPRTAGASTFDLAATIRM